MLIRRMWLLPIPRFEVPSLKESLSVRFLKVRRSPAGLHGGYGSHPEKLGASKCCPLWPHADIQHRAQPTNVGSIRGPGGRAPSSRSPDTRVLDRRSAANDGESAASIAGVLSAVPRLSQGQHHVRSTRIGVAQTSKRLSAADKMGVAEFPKLTLERTPALVDRLCEARDRLLRLMIRLCLSQLSNVHLGRVHVVCAVRAALSDEISLCSRVLSVLCWCRVSPGERVFERLRHRDWGRRHPNQLARG